MGAHVSGPQLPANAIIEGLTVYRRVLSDGANGDPATAGVDELNLIYAAGAGKKPEEVCPEDVVFAFPTDGVAGELSSGDGEAWHFPWGDNELLNYHLQEDTAGAPDNWTAVNAPTLADAETANILMDTRAQKITVDAANEGIKQAKVVTPGEDFVTLAWLKAGGANQGADLRIHDATHAIDIVEMTTDVTGSWTHFNTCWEATTGCVSVETYVESTDADTYSIYAQQVMTLPNLVDNGGMEGTYVDESGGGGGTVDVAPEWANSGCLTDGTDTLDESADEHSGAKAQTINVAAATRGIVTDANAFTANKWHQVTVWAKRTAGDLQVVDGAGGFLSESFTPSASYSRHSFITFATSATTLKVLSHGGAANCLVDDISIIELDDVSITATAASAANSAEESGIRVDGLDTLPQAIPVGSLEATRGEVQAGWIPRHDAADAVKFGNATAYICDYYGDANNYIRAYWSAANTITLAVNSGGAGVQTTTWNCTGAISANTEYLRGIRYTSSEVTLKIDGVVVATITTAIEFTTALAIDYEGTRQDGTLQSDMVAKAP
ncbi:MAG: hypothetical protein RTV72_17725 [Candidatus Thorarchaeota archaeon]